jgi:hypothetical protein
MGADSQGGVREERLAWLSARHRFPDGWYHLRNPVFLGSGATYGFGAGQTPPPYTLEFEIEDGDFQENEAQRRMKSFLISAAGAPGRIPVEVSFTPAGSTTIYSVNAVIEDEKLALTPSTAMPLTTLAPNGRWRIRLRNEGSPATYPEFLAGATGTGQERVLDVDWLENMLLVLRYDATVRYVT